jgi:DNA polymerase-1
VLCHEYGFRRFIDEAKALPDELKLQSSDSPSTTTPPASPAPARRWDVVAEDTQLPTFTQQLHQQREFALDVIASSPNPQQADVVAIAFAWENQLWFVPVTQRAPLPVGKGGQRPGEGSAESDSPSPLSRRQRSLFADEPPSHDSPERSPQAGSQQSHVWNSLRPILESLDVQIISHDLKFDSLLLRRAGIRLRGLGVDPMVASYLLEAGARGHDLAALSEKHLHQTLPAFDVALLNDAERLAEWATDRADAAWQLARQLSDALRREGLWDLYWNLERPLIGVLTDMEATGIRVDVSELKQQSAEIGRRLTALIAEIHQLAGHEFNIDSPKQLAKVLFEELGLPVMKKTKTGASTDQDVLEKLALVHPLPAKIIEHRQLSKLKGTYLDALPELVNPLTGKIHPRFNQVVAATGRLSSSDPNIQNIPIRTTEGHRVRRAFIPSEPGWKFVCADYSQIELRMLAHFCGDPVLCEAFAAGTDIHTAVACEIFNVTPDVVSSEQRRIAKAVNFGVLYGQSAFGLSEALHIDQDEAALFIDQYFAKYATVDDYITRTLAEVARTGYATTILGRRRAIDGIRPDRKRQLNLSERTAINTVIQGSAADLIKQAMLRVHHRLAETHHPGRLLLQIHDELVFETPATDVASLANLVREEMTTAMTLSVPLAVDVSVGDNWQELAAL